MSTLYSTPDQEELASEEEPTLWFANCHDFTVGYLLPMWRRRLNKSTRWCQHWYLHAEAFARLDALWRSFEAHRVSDDPSAMAVWWRDYCDPTMAALTREDGVFYLCDATNGVHKEPEMWRTAPPPAGLFSDERKIAPQSAAVFAD